MDVFKLLPLPLAGGAGPESVASHPILHLLSRGEEGTLGQLLERLHQQ